MCFMYVPHQKGTSDALELKAWLLTTCGFWKQNLGPLEG